MCYFFERTNVTPQKLNFWCYKNNTNCKDILLNVKSFICLSQKFGIMVFDMYDPKDRSLTIKVVSYRD